MKCFITLLFSVICCCPGLLAQKNVIKTKPLKMIGGLVSPVSPIPLNLSYERVLAPKLSISLNLTWGPKKSLDAVRDRANEAFTEIDPSEGYAHMNTLTAKRFYVSPELRFYPSIKKTPRGFYLSLEPYYSNLKAEIGMDYGYVVEINANGTTYPYLYDNSYDLTTTFRNMGACVGIGTQWLVRDRVSIDILWIGLGAGIGSISTSFEGELIDKAQIESDIEAISGEPHTISDDQIPSWENLAKEFEAQFGDTFSGIPLIGNNIRYSAEANGVSASYNGVLPKLRLLNFSVGVAF